MIPKKIHYCWFGGGSLPAKEQECIASWAKLLPDYEIVRWDESRFDIDSTAFTQEAYRAKKYAFVADYVRVFALKREGGIYLDTDVEVIRPLDDLLDCSFLSGFETDGVIQTGVIGSEPDSFMINKIYEYYEGRSFIKSNGEFDKTPNSAIIAQLMRNLGFQLRNQHEAKDRICLYPSEYFCPINQATWEIRVTDKTYCIHYLSGSWLPMKDRLSRKMKTLIGTLFGYKFVEKIRNIFK